jgi:hypothetical protein
MDVSKQCRSLGIYPAEQVAFARALQVGMHLFGRSRCWPLDKRSHPAFAGFSTSHKTTLLYKGLDARPLLLALSGRFQGEGEVAIRKAVCKSPYCLNPSHYYWGTRAQVALERRASEKKSISLEVVKALRTGRQEGKRVLDLARTYKVPYHTARRICAGETFENLNETKQERSLESIWETLRTICDELVDRYPEEAREYNLAIHVAAQLECPWHRKGLPGHKGNFGMQGECLDCMEELKNGRCSVDVTNFDLTWYWQVKRFWDQVDIRDEDECWQWRGATRKNGTESLAYFPSPFHSGKTQSASRVAFWLSRGYTGKYRVFARPTCLKFCCNPKHLHIREFEDHIEPLTIGEVKLNHGNIFEHYRDSDFQAQSSVTD